MVKKVLFACTLGLLLLGSSIQTLCADSPASEGGSPFSTYTDEEWDAFEEECLKASEYDQMAYGYHSKAKKGGRNSPSKALRASVASRIVEEGVVVKPRPRKAKKAKK